MARNTAAANGRTVVVKRGRLIVSVSNKGQEKVLRTLHKAYAFGGAKSYKV